jgi:hypothetical protein
MIEKPLTFIKKINFKRLLRLFSALALLLPPLIFCVIWYVFEYEERTIFTNLEVRGTKLQFDSTGEMSASMALPDALYDYTKDEYPMQFEKANSASEFENFKSKVSEKLTENIGVFSSLPIYNVCLVNQNKIFINGEIQDNLEPSKGATSIKQEKGYEFYAPIGKRDCMNVVIEKFRNSRSRVEYGYIFAITIDAGEESKRMQGKTFSVSVATSSVDASKTKITVSLRILVLLLSYFLILFAWSFVFFQYDKIIAYMFRRTSN